LRYIVEKEGIPLALGNVGRSFIDAFGADRVNRATAATQQKYPKGGGNVALFTEIVADVRGKP
jgi:hypothetical protein